MTQPTNRSIDLRIMKDCPEAKAIKYIAFSEVMKRVLVNMRHKFRAV